MAWTSFAEFSPSDSLTSLSTMCMHVLCRSVNKFQEYCPPLSPLYDVNTWDEDESWYDVEEEDRKVRNKTTEKTPKRFLEVLFEHNTEPPLLDIKSRQAIFDYILRERIPVRSDFFLLLLKDGALYDWNLEAIDLHIDENDEKRENVLEQIFVQMCSSSEVIRTLTVSPKCVNNDPEVWKKHLENAKFPNLTNFDLAKGSTVEFPIDACPNLHELYINKQNFNQISRCLKSEPPLFRSVIELRISKHIEEDEVMFCLANFPKTALLCLKNIGKLIKHLNATSEQQMAQSALKVLTNLHYLCPEECISTLDLELLLQTCPNLEELSIEVKETVELQKLARFTKLQKLEIVCKSESLESDSEEINFSAHIVPLLELIGTRLTALSLDGFYKISLADCARLCPNLESFCVSFFDSAGDADLLLAYPLTKLKSLRLCPIHLLNPSIVRCILPSAHQLEHIDISGNKYLSDVDLKIVNALNPLEKLKTFCLENPRNVEKCRNIARLLFASLSCGNLVYHNCALTEACLALPDGTIVNRHNFYLANAMDCESIHSSLFTGDEELESEDYDEEYLEFEDYDEENMENEENL